MYVKMFDFAWLVFEASFISHGFVVGFVLLITGLVFWFGFKAPEEPSFKGLSASSASKTTPKKSNKKKTQSNGEILTDSAGSLNKQKSKPKQTVKTSSVLKDTKSLHTAERFLSSVDKQTPVSENKEGSKQSSNEKSGSRSRGKAEDDGWESVSRKEKKIKKQASDEPTKTELPKERKKREVPEKSSGANDSGEKSNQVTLSKQPDGTKTKTAHTKNVEKSPSSGGAPTKVSNNKGKTLPESSGKNKSNKVAKKEVKSHSAVANHEAAKGSSDGADAEDEEEENKREKQQQRSKKLPSKETDNKGMKSGKENIKNSSSTIAVEKNSDSKLKGNRKSAEDDVPGKAVIDEKLPTVATAITEGSVATNEKKLESGDKTKKSTSKPKPNEKPDQDNRKEEAIVTAKKFDSKQSAPPITIVDETEKKSKTKTPTIKSERAAGDSGTEKRSNKSGKKEVNEGTTKEKTPLTPANSNEKPKLSNSKRKRQESSDKNSVEEAIDEFADKEITTIIVTNTNYKAEEGEEEEDEEKENSKKSKFNKTKAADRTAQSKLGNRNNGSKKLAASAKTRNQEIVNESNNDNSKTESSPIDEDSSWKEAKANKKKKKPIKEP